MQLALHSIHQAFSMAFRVLYLEVFHLLGTIYPRTLQRELQQIELLAALRHGEGHAIK